MHTIYSFNIAGSRKKAYISDTESIQKHTSSNKLKLRHSRTSLLCLVGLICGVQLLTTREMYTACQAKTNKQINKQ